MALLVLSSSVLLLKCRAYSYKNKKRKKKRVSRLVLSCSNLGKLMYYGVVEITSLKEWESVWLLPTPLGIVEEEYWVSRYFYHQLHLLKPSLF